jgi:hypothetical protein
MWLSGNRGLLNNLISQNEKLRRNNTFGIEILSKVLFVWSGRNEI